jgi:heme-binding protein
MTSRGWRFAKSLIVTIGVILGLFGLVQLVPYGRTHSNPPKIQEPRWDSPRTRELAVRACFDCHSNETRWPWYADIAPMSWAVQFDVEAARTIVNFSEWNGEYPLAGYSGRRTLEGNMPPYKYRKAHPDADLTQSEREELARGLDASLALRNASR